MECSERDESLKVSFITWYPNCRRSDALAAALGGESHLIHHLRFKQPFYAPVKYLLQTVATWRQLLRDGADLVLVASPPTFAVLAVWLYCRIPGKRYIIDAHTGIFDDRRWTWLAPLNRFFARGAVTTIVTNRFLKDQVESWGAQAMIIGDVPVDFPAATPVELGPGSHVVVINTFSEDEPLDEVMKAAAKLPAVHFHVTGNLKHSRSTWTESPPGNVRFTGWVTDTEYAELLRAADVIMCLTTHDHTMQRGAYEAMALGKPLITSNWEILRETFSAGTIHVDNTADDITSAIAEAVANQAQMHSGMRELATRRLGIFQSNLNRLQEILS